MPPENSCISRECGRGFPISEPMGLLGSNRRPESLIRRSALRAVVKNAGQTAIPVGIRSSRAGY